MWFDRIQLNKPLLQDPNSYEVVTRVAPSGHYGCGIVMSDIGIKKALSQWLYLQKVSRLCLHKMRVLKHYVENKALFETWK